MEAPLAVGEGIVFPVIGKPAPGGSKTLRPLPDGKFAVRPSSKRTKPWMRTCEAIYKSHWGDRPAMDCPVAVNVTFYVARPRNAAGQLHPKKSGNDLDKLLRATLDPLAKSQTWGGVITNDRRIVRVVAERRFGEPERAEVELIRLPEVREEQPEDQMEIADGLGEFEIPESVLALAP